MYKTVKKTQSRSTSELYDKCTYAEWLDIVDIPYYHEIIRAALELYIKHELDTQRAGLIKYVGDSILSNAKINAYQQSEILQMFNINDIEVKEFCNSVITVFTKSDLKRNTLRMWGVSNSCKSLIANALCLPFICCYMNNHCSENEFYMSAMLNKSVILCEELYITVATAEDFKSVLCGQPINVAKKYNEKQLLSRTPVVITSNHQRMGRGHLPAVDEMALQNRCFNYYFSTSYKPKCYINSENMWYFIVLHADGADV